MQPNELATAGETEDVFEVIARMRHKGVRRMPIVDEEGNVAGIVSIDDMIEILAGAMTQLARIISREQLVEQETRR